MWTLIPCPIIHFASFDSPLELSWASGEKLRDLSLPSPTTSSWLAVAVADGCGSSWLAVAVARLKENKGLEDNGDSGAVGKTKLEL